MKRLSILSLFVVSCHAQVSITVGSVTVPNEVSTAVETWRIGQTKVNTTPITLVGAITSGALSGTVSDAGDIAVNDQIVIEAEALNVTAKTGNVLTWTRGASITTAAAHADKSVVKVCKYRSAAHLMKEMIRSEVNAILAQQPSTTLQTQSAAKRAADAAIETFFADTVK